MHVLVLESFLNKTFMNELYKSRWIWPFSLAPSMIYNILLLLWGIWRQTKRRKRSIFGDGGRGSQRWSALSLIPSRRGATATKSDRRGRWRNILILNILILQTKTMDQYCYSDSPAAVLVCVLWTILPSPPCCSGSFRRPNGAWIPVSLVQLLAQFFILNCRHNFAGCLFSQIIKIKHRDFTPALNKLRHATAIILLKFARCLA